MKFQLQIKNSKIFAPILNSWIIYTPEEEVRQKFIIRLLNEYGYNVSQMRQDVEIGTDIFVDIAIWKHNADLQNNAHPTIIIAVDCKAEYISIRKQDVRKQYQVATLLESDFFIATNLKETKVFQIIKKTSLKDFDDLKDLPKANQIVSDESIKKYIEETKAFTREDFTKLLNKCHNIIRNNDKLSPEAAFDEISKILFIKIMYEKNPDKELIFTWDSFLSKEKYHKQFIEPQLKEENPNYNKDFIQYEFDATKRKFKEHKLFEENDIIKIKRSSFESIVRELESYNLSSTSDDIKGIAFEEFLGRTFRGELGQFFTPRTVVDFMVKILDPQEGEKICDPCCGSGGFLIKTFDYIREKIENSIYEVQNEIELRLNKSEKKKNDVIKNLLKELDINTPKGRMRDLSYNCIYGTDANPRMARTAKMNMIMHGDGHGGVHHNDGLINVNGIFENRFDVILTNPPFGARVDKNQLITSLDLPDDLSVNLFSEKYKDYDYFNMVVKPLQEQAQQRNSKTEILGTPLLDLFETGKYSSLTEVLFIERCINLLKPGGRMGIVLPEGVLNNNNLDRVRNFVESKAKIILITSLPQDVFIASGATVKPSVLFLKKFTVEEAYSYETIRLQCKENIDRKFQIDLNFLKKRLKEGGAKMSPEERAELKKKEKDLLHQMNVDYKKMIKSEFDYQLAIAEVEKAGISTTGSVIENQLEPLEQEFLEHRKNNQLWNEISFDFKYKIEGDKIWRVGNKGIEDFSND